MLAQRLYQDTAFTAFAEQLCQNIAISISLKKMTADAE
jgi:hypothetical protein